jgi:Holliday junction DNA helicase RuvB
LQQNAKILDISLTLEGARLIAQRSRGTPRIANRFLRRIRDVAQVKGAGQIDPRIAKEGMNMLGIDPHGLDALDRKILKVIIDHGGGPVGLKTIAVSVSEEEDTIETVYEPFLIQEGYLQKTPRGRKVSLKAYQILGLPHQANFLF